MMQVMITCYATFKDICGEVSSLELPDSSSIGDAIRALAIKAGPDGGLFVNENGAVREYVMIMYRGDRIVPAETENIRLEDKDMLTLFPPVSGG
ncbi:MAG TPA: MoaD/ThiS family protein [Methanospirillum sp.]|nr:MoaD/ThiS family protein [Methanospirillum sp.]